LLSTLLLALAPAAVPQREQGDVRIAPERLEGLIESLAKEIEDRYVFPDVGHQIAERLRERMFDGAYEDATLESLAGRLEADLRSINHDKHLGVSPVLPTPAPEAARQQELDRTREMRRLNYGFQKVEILDGNVGYLDLRGFLPIGIARETAAGAMALLANVDALVIDLRRNGGGDPSMTQFLCSYFFAERTHLSSIAWRGLDAMDELWTFDDVPGKRLVDVPIFVLTSSSTFSAAEGFAYALQSRGRATVIGENTGGGAHPGSTHEIGGLLSVFIPNGQAVNPITKTNWEGVGVEPLVKIPAEQALETAKREAARSIAERRARPPTGG